MRRAAVAATADSRSTRRGARTGRSHRIVAAAAVTIVAALVIGGQFWARQGAVVQAAMRFEVRPADDQPGPGLQAARVARSNRVVYLHRDVIVTNGDIAGSRVVPGASPAEFWIDVRLNAAGAEKMRQATMNHIGKPVAILIDGDVVTAPTLKSAIGAAALISGSYTRADAERIATGIAPNQ